MHIQSMQDHKTNPRDGSYNVETQLPKKLVRTRRR